MNVLHSIRRLTVSKIDESRTRNVSNLLSSFESPLQVVVDDENPNYCSVERCCGRCVMDSVLDWMLPWVVFVDVEFRFAVVVLDCVKAVGFLIKFAEGIYRPVIREGVGRHVTL